GGYVHRRRSSIRQGHRTDAVPRPQDPEGMGADHGVRRRRVRHAYQPAPGMPRSAACRMALARLRPDRNRDTGGCMNPTERNSAILAKVDAEIARLVRLRRQLQSRGVVEWWCNDLVDYIELKDEAYSLGNGDVDSGPLETCIYYRVEWGEWPGD